jgi:Na+-translocating ferredoxin:NAD+ oxidoreductase RnfG subunit
MKALMNSIIKPTIIFSIIALISALTLSHINKITFNDIQRQKTDKEKKALLVVLPGYKDIKKNIVKLEKKKTFTYWIGKKEIIETKKKDKKNKKKKPKEPELSTGYAFITSKPGYSGDVETMVGIEEKGIILGIFILQQTETPGLGARSTEIASTTTFLDFILGRKNSAEKTNLNPWFQEQFKGLKTKFKIDTPKPDKKKKKKKRKKDTEEIPEEIKIGIVKMGDWDIKLKDKLINLNSISAITGATITSTVVTDSINEGILLLMKVINIKTTELKQEGKK